MSAQPLMPKATAVWLVENTALTFDQIADFCKLHPLEVKAIADDEGVQSIIGRDPIGTGQLSRDELAKGEADPSYKLKLAVSKVHLPEPKRKKGPRYTPVSRRQDRPNAILWLVRNHPELKDSQIMRLVGTTKSTIEAIRERTHWNAQNLTPMDPVTLGLCSQIDLDFEVQRAAKDRPQVETEAGATLLPAEVTTARPDEHEVPPEVEKKKDDDEMKAVFAKLQRIGSKEHEDEDSADEEHAAEEHGEPAGHAADLEEGHEAREEEHGGHEDHGEPDETHGGDEDVEPETRGHDAHAHQGHEGDEE